MDQAIKAQWVAALRSGEYKQVTGALARNGGYCCLGVLCELAVAEGVVIKQPEDIGRPDYFEYGLDAEMNKERYEFPYDSFEGSILPGEVADWAGLNSFNPSIGQEGIVLSMLNDGEYPYEPENPRHMRRHTFAEIADLIDANL